MGAGSNPGVMTSRFFFYLIIETMLFLRTPINITHRQHDFLMKIMLTNIKSIIRTMSVQCK